MGLISFIAKRLKLDTVPLSGKDLVMAISEAYVDVYIRELAFWSCVNIVANAVSKCEFTTYVKGKETKGAEYYLWNIEPNKNQNSSVFIHKLIAELYRNNECLVIESNGQLLVADSFDKNDYALYDDEFTNVTVKGFTFDKTFKQSEVLYWQLSSNDMKQVIDALYDSYSKLIAYSIKAYKKARGTKGIFKVDTIPKPDTPEDNAYQDLIKNKFKKFLEEADAILSLGSGQAFTELNTKTYSNESTRDIRALIDDILDFTARAIGIPPALPRGDVQDTSKAIDQLLTFCIDPLTDMLQEEINRKRIGKEEYLRGTKLVIDTKTIKHIDLFSITAAIDKLVSSGSFCVNDIRKAVGEEPINEEWADKFFMTKNYATVEEVLKQLERGDKNEE